MYVPVKNKSGNQCINIKHTPIQNVHRVFFIMSLNIIAVVPTKPETNRNLESPFSRQFTIPYFI